MGFTSLGEMYVRSDAPLNDAQRKALVLAIGVPHDDDDEGQRHPQPEPSRVDRRAERLPSTASAPDWSADSRSRRASRSEREAIASERLGADTLPEFVSIRVGWLRKTLGDGARR